MKKTLILFMLICMGLAFTGMSQDDKAPEFNTKKFQVSIGIADVFAKNNWWYAPYYYDEYGYLIFEYPDGNYYRQPNLVLGFKYLCNKGALRTSLSFRYSQSKYKDDDSPTEELTAGNFGTGVSLGYEWHSTFGRLNIYYGFDGSFSITNYNLTSELNENSILRKQEYTINESTYGVSPLIGFNYFIVPRLSIGTEIKFTGEYMSRINKSKYSVYGSYYDNTEENKVTESGFRTYFGPLGFLSLNIYF